MKGETVEAASNSWCPRPPCPGRRWRRLEVASHPDRAMGVLLQREGNRIMKTRTRRAESRCAWLAVQVLKRKITVVCSLILSLVAYVKYFTLHLDDSSH